MAPLSSCGRERKAAFLSEGQRFWAVRGLAAGLVWRLPGRRPHSRSSPSSLGGCVGRPPPSQKHRPRLICHLRGHGTLRRQARVHTWFRAPSFCMTCVGRWPRAPLGRQAEGPRASPHGTVHPQQSRVSQTLCIPLGQVDSCGAAACPSIAHHVSSLLRERVFDPTAGLRGAGCRAALSALQTGRAWACVRCGRRR